MKNTIYLIVIVVCLILAVVIFVATRPGRTSSLEQLKRGELYWVQCNNPDCKALYQMDKVDYYKELTEKTKANPLAMQTPPLTCKKCGKESVFRAIKCENCGKVFFYGAVQGDLPDRCPDCKYSNTEAIRKARLSEAAGSQ